MNAWFLLQLVIMVAVSSALISLWGFDPWHAYAWVAGGGLGLAAIGFGVVFCVCKAEDREEFVKSVVSTVRQDIGDLLSVFRLRK